MAAVRGGIAPLCGGDGGSVESHRRSDGRREADDDGVEGEREGGDSERQEGGCEKRNGGEKIDG